MKGIGFSFASVVLLLCLSAKAEIHEFSLPDGRSIKAEIVDFNGKQNIVQLRLENGKIKKISPAVFVAEDRAYIRSWAEMAGFRSPSFFKVSGQKKKLEKWKKEEEGKIEYSDGSKEMETISETKFEKYVYEVSLENKNDTALEGLKLEYRIFFEQSLTTGADSSVAQNKVVGEFEVPVIKAKGRASFTTSHVVIHEKEWNGDITYNGSVYPKETGDIHGIWIRVSMTGADGKPVIRNIYEPSSLDGKYSW